MRFSIIVPVYNVEKYIDKCMYTLTHQTFDDYEVIVVNDETPDNSMQIVEKYAQAFPGKIRMFHQKNTRQGGARNNGVAQAKGEYIMFVDSDDYVAINMLETVNDRLTATPSDILVFRYAPVSEKGELLPEVRHNAIEPGVYHPRQDKTILLLATGPVNKVFRREFYVNAGVQFPEKLLYEDGVTRVFYAMAQTIEVCDDVLYYYVQSESSSMRREISEKMLDILPVTDIALQEFKKRGLYEDFREVLDCSLIYGILTILDYINDIQMDHPIQKPMAVYIADHFPNYRNNPYFSGTLCKALDYIVAYDFKKYHYRIRVAGKIKEQILRIPGVAKLNDMRHRK